MYNNRPNTSGQNRRPANFGGNSNGGNSFNSNGGNGGNGGNRRSFGGGGRNFSSNRGGNGGGRGSRFRAQYIDPSIFVNKSQPIEDVKYVTENTFDSFDIDQRLKNNIKSKGYSHPTQIQDETLPLILAGHDVIGIANTGTGKTAAFLIPLIDKVIKDKSQKVMIIVPTRELAGQIRDELFSFTKDLYINSTVCIGGADIRRQMVNLKRGSSFVIATPGRLKDLMMRRAIDIANFQNIVLDEVDRMLDMGFYPEIKFLIEKMPFEKQSLFFSATLDGKIETIANGFLREPIKVMLKTRETSANIDQDVVIIDKGTRKFDKLHQLLQDEKFIKVLVFSNTKRGVERLEEDLLKNGHKVESIHGDKSQFKRQKALDSFKSGRAKVLIATDVVARGIDVVGITHVVNYDLPGSRDAYTHRIGRTGRGDQSGIALTFIER